MSRTQVVGGNWKMNLDRARGVTLAEALAEQSPEHRDLRVMVFPPFPYLEAVGKAVRGSPVELGAQCCHPESGGAYTGAVSAPMCKDIGAGVALVGHSERRQYNDEKGDFLARQVKALLAEGLTPVLCIGERLEQRQAGKVEEVLQGQLEAGLKLVLTDEEARRIIVAYEPVWAIGTGETATPETAQEAHAFIRRVLGERLSADIARRTPIMYGGSVKPHNAASLLAEADIDGALVGGASLKADSFLPIIEAAAEKCRNRS